MTSSGTVTVRAPAKVNLELSVGGPRPDGFHDLATVFQAVSLTDDVTATVADAARGITLTVEGLHADRVPTDDSNLAVRAARLLAARTGIDDGLNLHIRKGIPVAGGLAGGSADAAATLLACDALWHTGLTREELCLLAAELGSDVPFSLIGGTAIGLGRGEQLTPALARGDYHWVLALRHTGLSTPAVYREIDRLRAGRVLPEPAVSARMMHALRSGDPATLGATLSNDLQPAACSLEPGLLRTLEIGREHGALGGIVSGSGPTAAFLVRDLEQSLDVAVALTASGVAADVRRVHGPVPGARVVEPARG